ncbi:hypothetical protein [Streptomyces sp. NPDC048650]|uniref:hypothetical protein n=1 Tax=Streptomyces sp. NPDC048650 TaxID=3365583 RepID=UPI0037241C05
MTLPGALPTTRIAVDHDSAVDLAAGTARTAAGHCCLPAALPDRAAVIARIHRLTRDDATALAARPQRLP